MKVALQSFLAGTTELERFLDSSAKEAALLSLLLPEERRGQMEREERALLDHLAGAVTDRRRYIYAVAIVSLYGLLERYIDGLIADYIERFSSLVPSFGDMPEAIRKNHFDLSIELARLAADDRYRLDLRKEEIIMNLHGCLSGAVPFQLNSAAFAIHRGNVNLQRIGDFLSRLGVAPHLPKVFRACTMQTYLRSRDPDRDYSRISDSDLEAVLQPIDDLVARRNEVSHGVVNVDNLESIDLLHERCRFVAAYGTSLHEVLMQEVIERQIGLPDATALGRALKVFNRTIVCFKHSQCRIKVGDILVARTGDPIMPFRFAPIDSIQIDGENRDEITLTEDTQFAMKTSLRASESFEYVVLPAADAA
ncbi:hypothetical protein JYK14_02990 [Siccirubricoccus sp. KC 17139]|uniref:RiboL-PSP-HEPN domain-containing protein n=1 Tax=Siccirubricoccus soli TaxID=2899147 RepID=A0ABT1D0F0_9PROT|nr:MAE_28990/MAE_18760 family HEPN-like nuclease [Siccirubricoccus soli]MCO6415142.1 hypothetical protein [Siccirubricoccus soli]MCP2681273.1 MAE_28990/MAE_18760 family HEPN-like nuclease [Siccirubricoccus soli]